MSKARICLLYPQACPEEKNCHISYAVQGQGDYNLCSGSKNNIPQHFPNGGLCPVLKYKISLRKQTVNNNQ